VRWQAGSFTGALCVVIIEKEMANARVARCPQLLVGAVKNDASFVEEDESSVDQA
jgi:hypothetical protein